MIIADCASVASMVRLKTFKLNENMINKDIINPMTIAFTIKVHLYRLMFFFFWNLNCLRFKIRIAIAGADKHTFSRYPSQGNPVITIKRNNLYSSYIEIPIISF